MNSMKTAVLTILASVAFTLACSAQAALLAEYTFPAANGSPQNVAAGVDAGDLGVGAGIPLQFSTSQATTNGRSLFVRGNQLSDSESNAIAANDYWTFKVTPDAGKTLALSMIEFDYRVDGGITDKEPTWYVYSSVDGFTLGNNIGEFAITQVSQNKSWFNASVDLSALSGFDALDSETEFRVYVKGEGSSSEIRRIDTIQLSGEVQMPAPAVPEPMTASLAGLGFIAMLTRRRRGA